MGMRGLVTDPDIKAFIKREGIVLKTWRKLAHRRKQLEDSSPLQ